MAIVALVALSGCGLRGTYCNETSTKHMCAEIKGKTVAFTSDIGNTKPIALKDSSVGYELADVKALAGNLPDNWYGLSKLPTSLSIADLDGKLDIRGEGSLLVVSGQYTKK